MSISIPVVGIRPKDEKFDKMKQILDTCQEMKVSIPSEVVNFFGKDVIDDGNVGDFGVEVSLLYPNKSGVTAWENSYAEGYLIDLRELDPSIKIIRVYIP